MKKNYFLKTILLFIIFSPDINYAQLSITSTDINFIIDFDNTVLDVNEGSYLGIGLTPTPLSGQLDGNAWEITGFGTNHNFNETSEADDMARGVKTTSVGIGGLYSFEVVSGNYTIGVQPGSSDFTTGNIILKITNNTGTLVNSIALNYVVYILNDQNRSSSFNFSYSSDNITYTKDADLDITSIADADNSLLWIENDKSTIIPSLNLSNGSHFYLKWTGDDVGGTGSRDQFALDDIIINMSTEANTILSNETIDENFSNVSIYKSSNNEVTITGLTVVTDVDVYSLVGEKITTISLHPKDINKISLPTLNYGFYILKLTSLYGTMTKKIILN